MPFDFRRVYEEQGLEYGDFLERFGTDPDRRKWKAVYDRIALTEAQRGLIRSFVRPMPVLVMAGAWCGDCAKQCPILVRIAAENPLIQPRFVDRDQVPDLAGELQICGAPRIPQTVMFDADFHPVNRMGERTLSQVRALAARLAGASCATGLMSDEELAQITGEWMDQVENGQLILRLSPRLRERYGD